jgi:hypothetical protein
MQLAQQLGVAVHCLESIGVGWADAELLNAWGAGGRDWTQDRPSGAFTFPECNGESKVVGVSLRTDSGRKGAPSGRKTGSKRGLVVPRSLTVRADPVLLVEGASDVAALETLGLAAVGRPSNTAGATDLARLLRGREVIVVGERDQKPDGRWPGREGAEQTAARLAACWKRPVVFSLVPEGSKDVRDWLRSRDLDLSHADACAAAGEELLAALRAGEQSATPDEAPSPAELIVQLALEKYRIGCSLEREPFAVEKEGPNIALMFASRALRAALARDFRRRYGKTPSAAALADAMIVLEGEAQEVEREPLHLRIAPYGDGIVLDLGTNEGTAIIVTAKGRQVALHSPVVFRRSELIGALPMPVDGGSIDDLRQLVNAADRTWPLALGWLVAGFIPNVPHPILMLGGLHDAGKSTAARMLVGILDPSPVPLRSPPNDDRNWAVACNASYALVIDNVSSIPPWWSDALCKSVTGDGYPFRKLFTNSEITVLAFRRVVAITSIDAGALRGDLGDRLLLLDLEPIDDSARRTERDLDQIYASIRPQVLGAVLDLLSRVLAELPNVKLDLMPRLADFAVVLAAMDRVIGTNALVEYLGQRDHIAAEVIDSDPIGQLIVALMDTHELWQGTATELLKVIKPEGTLPRGWPSNARAFSGRLRRLIPALRSVGVRVRVGERKPGKHRDRLIEITRADPQSDGTQNGTVRDGSLVPDRPAENSPGSTPEWDRDGRNGSDGPSESSSEHPDGVDNEGCDDEHSPSHSKVADRPSQPSEPSRNGPGASETWFPTGRSRDGRGEFGTVDRPEPDDVVEPVTPPGRRARQEQFTEDPDAWEH